MKHGFTLIELLVYMAIMSFIIVVAGRVFSDSTSMRVRSQNMVKNTEEVGRISNLINEDISQMGTKAYGTSSASSYQVIVNGKVYMETPTDSSSYALYKKANGDSLVFRKMAFNQNGSYAGVREISWYLKEGNIYRSCKTIDGAEDSECPKNSVPKKVLMGGNITKLEFFPSKPGVHPGSSSSDAPDILFTSNVDSEFGFAQQPSNGDAVELTISEAGSNTLLVRGFPAQNSSSSKRHATLCLAEAGTCKEFKFYKGETYAIEFEMPFFRGEQGDSISSQFLPGEDHLTVGLRKSDYNTLPDAPPDVLIYPPQSFQENLLRHIEITPKNDISASIALTFAFYSPKAYMGSLRFKDFKIFRKSDEAFHFPKGDYGADKIEGTAPVNISEKNKQKKNAKAFEMILELEHKGEKAGTYAKDGKGMVILTPNNGILAVGSGL